MTKGFLLVFSLALSVAAPALFCQAQTGQPSDVAHGKELFLRYCSGCHGEDGRGEAKTFRPNVANLSVKGLMDQMTDDERPKVSTVAELFAYVSAAWDTGGKSYCATRTWFGTGLQDAFERLATQERVSEAERPDIVRQMIAAMPACRRCGCVTPRRGNGRRAPARVRSWGRGEGRSMPINVT